MENIQKYLKNVIHRFSGMRRSTQHNVIYVCAAFLACIIMFCVTRSHVNVTAEFFNNFFSEINYIYALMCMQSSGNDTEYYSLFIIPILYVFLSRIIYYGLKSETPQDKILQILGNCLLQVFLSICLYNNENADAISSLIMVGTVYGGIYISYAIAIVKTKSCIRAIPRGLKYFFSIPMIRMALIIEAAFLGQAVILILITAVLQIFHIAILILPLSFVITPVVLNKVSDAIYIYFNRRAVSETR